jgi:hypothetical protein
MVFIISGPKIALHASQQGCCGCPTEQQVTSQVKLKVAGAVHFTPATSRVLLAAVNQFDMLTYLAKCYFFGCEFICLVIKH